MLQTYKLLFLVDGVWADWPEWGLSDCSVTCGGGDQSRTRLCNNPPPQHGGADCTADGTTDTETQACNDNPCPSKSNTILLSFILRVISN